MFRPSHESLILQNAEIDRLELPRIQDDDELEALKASQALMPIRASESLRFDPVSILRAALAVRGRVILPKTWARHTTIAFTSRFR